VAHLEEIFSTFGKIKDIEFGNDKAKPWINKGFAYIEYETPEEAQNAMKHMDGGQIDGQEITAAPVLMPRAPARRPSPKRRSPVGGRRRSPSPGRRRNSPPRGGRRRSPSPRRRRSPSPRRRSPPRRGGGGGRSRSPVGRRRSPPRKRSRSPARRRRHSTSSSSSDSD